MGNGYICIYGCILNKFNNISLVLRREANVRVHTTSVLNTPPSTKLGGKMGPKDTVASIPSDWILYEEMSRGHRLAFVQCCTVVSPITVAIFCGPAKLASDALKEPEKAYFNGNIICQTWSHILC